MKEVFKYEYKKAKLNKAWAVIFLAFFMVVLLSIIIAIFTGFNWKIKKSESYDKEVVRQEIAKELEKAEMQLATSGEILSESETKNLKNKISKLTFFLESDTCQKDYYSENNYSDELGAFISNKLWLYEILPIFAIGIICVFNIFGNEYKGRFKLMVAKGVQRKDIFRGKFAFLSSVTLCFYGIYAIIGLVAVLFSTNTKMLFYNENGGFYYSKSCLEIFASQYLCSLVAIFFVIIVLLFLCVATKKSQIALAVFVLLFAAEAIFVFGNIAINDIVLSSLPIFGLIVLAPKGFSGVYGIVLGIHAIASVLFLLMSWKIFRKQEL